jgi:hypothetical protein
VSPRDLWLCVLPRWQINVNVLGLNGYESRKCESEKMSKGSVLPLVPYPATRLS